MREIGRLLIGIGAFLLLAGGAILLSIRLGLPIGRLPGDVSVRGRHFTFYAPIVTCLLLSLVLSLLIWLVSFLRR